MVDITREANASLYMSNGYKVLFFFMYIKSK